MKKELVKIQKMIHEIRGQKVMLDRDLAQLYEVEIRVLNQAVKRNIERFPADFMFQLNAEEWKNLRSQFVIFNKDIRKYRPFVFTEHGICGNSLPMVRCYRTTLFFHNPFLFNSDEGDKQN